MGGITAGPLTCHEPILGLDNLLRMQIHHSSTLLRIATTLLDATTLVHNTVNLDKPDVIFIVHLESKHGLFHAPLRD